jgi:hypothetical protein
MRFLESFELYKQEELHEKDGDNLQDGTSPSVAM